MRLKILIAFLVVAALSWAAGSAQGGAVRYLGKKMQGPERVAASAADSAGNGVMTAGKSTTGVLGRGLEKTKDAAGATAGAVETAGSATSGVVKTAASATKDGATTVIHGAEAGAKAAPGAVTEGTKSVARGLKRIIW